MPSLIGNCASCIHCNGKMLVRSLSQAEQFNPDQVDLHSLSDQTHPTEADGSDMLARTSDPFFGNSDFNQLVVDAIPAEPEENIDPQAASEAQQNVDDVISEVNRILGEE